MSQMSPAPPSQAPNSSRSGGRALQRKNRRPPNTAQSTPEKRAQSISLHYAKKGISGVIIKDDQGQPTTRTLEEMRARAQSLRTELRGYNPTASSQDGIALNTKGNGKGLASRMMDKDGFKMDELKEKDISFIKSARRPRIEKQEAYIPDDEEVIMTKMIEIAEDKQRRYKAMSGVLKEMSTAPSLPSEAPEPTAPGISKLNSMVEVTKSLMSSKKWKESAIAINEMMNELESQCAELTHENNIKRIEGERIMVEFMKREKTAREEIAKLADELHIVKTKSNAAFTREAAKVAELRKVNGAIITKIATIHEEIAQKAIQPIISKDLQNGFEQAKRDKETLEAQKKEIITLYEKEYKRLTEKREKYDLDISNAKSGLEELTHHKSQLQQQFELAKNEISQQSKELLTVKRENARMKELYTTSSYTISGPGIRRQTDLSKEIMYKNMKLPYPANMLEVPMSPRYPIDPEKHFQDEVRRLRHLLDKVMDQIRQYLF